MFTFFCDNFNHIQVVNIDMVRRDFTVLDLKLPDPIAMTIVIDFTLDVTFVWLPEVPQILNNDPIKNFMDLFSQIPREWTPSPKNCF